MGALHRFDGEIEKRNLLLHLGNVRAPTLLRLFPRIQKHIHEFMTHHPGAYALLGEALIKYLYLPVGK